MVLWHVGDGKLLKWNFVINYKDKYITYIYQIKGIEILHNPVVGESLFEPIFM